jgi:hypothetical protein
MNLNNSPTVADIRDMLRHADDGEGHHILWADTDGEVHNESNPGTTGSSERSRDSQSSLKLRGRFRPVAVLVPRIERHPLLPSQELTRTLDTLSGRAHIAY